jgi:uncharacterized protein (TIGR02246 family)
MQVSMDGGLMNVALVLTLAAVVLIPGFGSAPAQDSSPPGLRVLIQTFQDVYNAHDASRMAELFTDDADQIMGSGPLTTGRPAIRRWWEARFTAMPPGRTISLTPSSMRVVSPDVGVINTIAVTAGRDPQGKLLPSATDRGSWIAINRAGQWRIAALRVLEPERSPSR